MNNIEELIIRQRDFFNSNQTKDVSFRIDQLRKFEKLIRDNEDLLYEAIYEDFGKSEFDTYASELSLVYHEIHVFIRNIKKWSKRKRVPTSLTNFPAQSYIIPEPLGVTLIIGAWNYPYQLSLVPSVTSLAAGNTVVLKPSELPSHTSRVMSELINDNFPSEYFHVLEGGVKETTELLEHRFDKIFFTGSTPVGKIIYEAAAKHLTPVTLELGGKSPTIVLADCDLKMTAKRITWGKFMNAGQTCVAPDYILVEKKIETPFLEALKNEIDKFYQKEEVGENYTRILNTKNFDRLSQMIDTDKVCHGGIIDHDKRFIGPTVLKDVSFDDKVMEDEIFGPILPVLSFEDIDEVIQRIKERPKPLAFYIYSKNRRLIDKFLKEISFGGGAVNDSVMHLSNSHLPFGGVGLSGMGNYHGKTGFETFSHQKSILDKPFWFESNIKYAPYSKMKLKLIKWLME